LSDALLFDAIDELVPAETGAFGGWDDVLQRAGIVVGPPVRRETPRVDAHRRKLLTRRRVLVLALVATALGALLATPAFGIRQLLLDLVGRTNVRFSSGESAPLEVKRQFFDLSLGAPPRMAPQAIASQARRVAVFHVAGRAHVLYVAPTRKGGFCETFTGDFGSCGATRDERVLGLTWTGSPMRFPPPPNEPPQHTTEVGGDVLAASARTVRVEYEDGSATPIPFTFVSKPIDAGFFLYGIPKGHERPGTRVRAVSVLDDKGHVLARQRITYVTPRVPRHLPLPRPIRVIHRSPRLPPPSPPIQQGADGGVVVRAGRNGVAVFDTTGATPRVKKLIRGLGLDYVCFSYMPYHEDVPAELGFMRTTLPHVAIRTFGVPTPFAGCEVQGSYGHVWPDRNGSHSAVEIAFGERARRFFADRAAARDLALFARSRTMHRLRRLPPGELEAALVRRYGRAPWGRIRFAIRNGGATFSERSPTGRRFVVVVRNGRIVRENVKPFAFVF